MALILPEFLFMKTVQEDEITHCFCNLSAHWNETITHRSPRGVG